MYQQNNLLWQIGIVALLMAAVLLPVSASAEGAEAAGNPEVVNIPAATMPAIDPNAPNVQIKIPVQVTDADGNGECSINDAMHLAENAMKNNDGSDVYVYAVPNLEEAWKLINEGKEQPSGGSSGYQAYVYSSYSFFEPSRVTVAPSTPVTLKLSYTAFGENKKLVTAPLANTAITMGGQETGYVTDAQGNVTITLDTAGTFTLSAAINAEQCMPPSAVISVLPNMTIPSAEPVNTPVQVVPVITVPQTTPPVSETTTTTVGTETVSELPPDADTVVVSPPTGEKNSSGAGLVLCGSLLAGFGYMLKKRKSE